MKDRRELYFIGIVPPEPILTEVRAFKEIAALQFGSSRALRSPAHLTLVPPFRARAEERDTMLDQLDRALKDYPPFQVHLSGFDAFKPRVIFVDIVADVTLNKLHAAVMAVAVRCLGLSAPKRPFHPHMTVAFKDLRRSQFSNAWSYYSLISYQRAFQVSALCLLQNKPEGWIPLRELPLSTG